MLVTYTGKVFDFNNITKESICVEDIFNSLPKINRFIGHSTRAYSVGEHTLIGLTMAKHLGYTSLQQLQWLIHDFTEAYVGDCPTPLKKMLSKFSEIEKEVELAILDKLNLKPMTDEEHNLVKRIDATILVLEMRDLTKHDWNNFVNENTYIQFIYNRNFIIEDKFISQAVITHLLREEFNNLIKKVNTSAIEEGE